ncbi:uncharacterized protein LOC135102143 isoform X1 [Scylla paramamosain]|uniref:uncharacterized protein LOC135102143 isoform X1 n=1 Tax=Scylla paramamosain TaxID=85552 RepID=UPI003083B748
MAKEIVLKYPEILRAGRPLSFSLKFVSADGSLLDGAVFVDQKVLIEIQGRDVSAQGEVQILKRIYLPENNLLAIFVDVIISEVSVRYQLAAKVSVVPAGWHLQFVSPDLVVYPENLEVQENSVTKNVQMNVTRWLVAAPQVNPELEDRLMQVIMGVDMSVEGVYWGPVTFAPVTSGSSKKEVASFMITGPEDSMMAALERLCLELKAAVTIIIEQSCNKSSKYFVKKVYVEGNLLHCSQESSGTQDQLQDPQRIGRHKFSRG